MHTLWMILAILAALAGGADFSKRSTLKACGDLSSHAEARACVASVKALIK